MISDHDSYLVRMEVVTTVARVEDAYCAPHAVMRPRVFLDGEVWCALYGENVQDGVAGFGPTPEKACADFDALWRKGAR